MLDTRYWMLDIGYHSDIEIREMRMLRELPAACCIMYVSDLHLNRFGGPLMQSLLNVIEQCQPDLLLLGGDYIDTNAGMEHFKTLLLFLQNRCPVFAVAGNHDYFFGIKRIREMLEAHGVIWLEKESARLIINGINIQIDGNYFPESHIPAGLNILCLHRPVDVAAENNPYDLVLAGHLHGSQVVLWQNERGLYPGRWFYKWNLLQKRLGDCLYIVSKGLGDTLPLRFNCRRDVLVIKYNP